MDGGRRSLQPYQYPCRPSACRSDLMHLHEHPKQRCRNSLQGSPANLARAIDAIFRAWNRCGFATPAVVARLDLACPGHPVRRSLSVQSLTSGILGHPPARVTTSGCVFAISRHRLPEVCLLVCSLENGGRKEDRVRAAPAVSCAKRTKENAHEHTGSAESIRPSLRSGFTAYNVISPVRRALLPPSPPRSLLLENLTPASGARTTRLRRTRQPRSSVAAITSTASHRTFVTIASRPSHRVRRAKSSH
jgi:hypothetical protein